MKSFFSDFSVSDSHIRHLFEDIDNGKLKDQIDSLIAQFVLPYLETQKTKPGMHVTSITQNDDNTDGNINQNEKLYLNRKQLPISSRNPNGEVTTPVQLKSDYNKQEEELSENPQNNDYDNQEEEISENPQNNNYDNQEEEISENPQNNDYDNQEEEISENLQNNDMDSNYDNQEEEQLEIKPEFVVDTFGNLLNDIPTTIFYVYHYSTLIEYGPSKSSNQWCSSYFNKQLQDLFNLNSKEFSFYLYGLLSFLPKYWFNIIHSLFLLPARQTCIQKRKVLLENTVSIQRLSMTNDTNLLKKHILFHWMPNISFSKIPKFKLKNVFSDLRYCLAIDAAALSVNFGINFKTNKLIGTIPMQDNQNQTTSIAIAKYFFVLMLCPLDPNLKPVVIKREFTKSGLANKTELQMLKTAQLQLKQIGLEFIGNSSDGDRQYIQFPLAFYDKVSSSPNQFMSYPLLKALQIFKAKPWFQDVLHVIKCQRYNNLKGQMIRILASWKGCHVSKNDFESAFSQFSPNIMKDNQANKMDDGLVFLMFNWVFDVSIMRNNIFFAPILLPFTLLLQVFYNRDESLNRTLRYHYLNMGAAIVFIQLLSLKEETAEPLNTKKQEIYPISNETAIKYLLLAASLAPLFNDPRPFDLARCSSHLLEHFFGMTRKLCAGDNSEEKVDLCLEKAICLHSLLPKLKIPNKIPGRHGQDSAAIVEGGILQEPYASLPFGAYIHAAYDFFQSLFNMANIKIDLKLSLPKLSKLVIKYNYDSRVINFWNININASKPRMNTAKENRDVSSFGLSNMRRFHEMSDVKHNIPNKSLYATKLIINNYSTHLGPSGQ